MSDRTKQIVELVLKAPELLQALKDDPKALAARCGIPEQVYSLLENGRALVDGYLNRPSAGSAPAATSVTHSTVSGGKSPCRCKGACAWRAGGDNTVPLVGVVGLASLAGILSAAAVVAVVAVNNEDR